MAEPRQISRGPEWSCLLGGFLAGFLLVWLALAYTNDARWIEAPAHRDVASPPQRENAW